MLEATRVRLTSYLGTAMVQTLDGKVPKSSDNENGKEEGMKRVIYVTELTLIH